MHKDNRFYTLIITPATSSHFYKVMLHHRHVYAITIGSLMGLSLLMFTSIWVFKQAGLLLNYHRIQNENQLLKQKQSTLLRQLQSRLASIEAQSNQVRQIAEQMGLNVTGDLKIEELTPTKAVGGPSQLESFATELDRVATNLTELRADLDEEKVRLAMTPTGWPVLGPLNSRFGARRDPFGGGYESHSGIDIGAAYGTPVRATADGVVVRAGWSGGYGLLVVVDHGRGVQTYYGHLSRIDVSVGNPVHRDNSIGRVGSTGRATAPHIHYEIRIHDQPTNPLTFSQSQ